MPSAHTTQTAGATHWSIDPKAGREAEPQPIMLVVALRNPSRSSGLTHKASHSGTGHCDICPVQLAVSPAFSASQPVKDATTAAVMVQINANTAVATHTKVFMQTSKKWFYFRTVRSAQVN